MREKILVVDDEPDVVELIGFNLRSRGYEVISAKDGMEALLKARRLLPDLVVLDVMMPGQSGWEVCRSIRETQSLKDTGVIMLTGVGHRMNEMTSPLYGADAFIDKPFEFEDLDSKIDELVKKKR